MGRNRKRVGAGAVTESPATNRKPLTAAEHRANVIKRARELGWKPGFLLFGFNSMALERPDGTIVQVDNPSFSYAENDSDTKLLQFSGEIRIAAPVYGTLGRRRWSPGNKITIGDGKKIFSFDDLNKEILRVADLNNESDLPKDSSRQYQLISQAFYGWDEPGVFRRLEPGGMARAWNRTTADQLRNLLTVESDVTMLENAYRLPTPREYFGRPNPDRPALDANDITRIARATANALYEGRDNARDRNEDNVVQATIGAITGKLPRATNIRFRIGRDTKQMVGRIADIADEARKSIPNLRSRAQVVFLADIIGGLSLTRERLYETMILTRGGLRSGNPKGVVLGEAVKRVIKIAQKIAHQINEITGESTSNRTGIPNPNTMGGRIYRKLITDAGAQHNWTMMNHKSPLYSAEDLDSVNNN